ncbi:nuclease-related domain-containing protein [Streptomyces smyrnaeus]|uniref:nuclease-related domain-containing protein n=2 Tax=Streptomyces smyrnaeus TaxID=1387713 RepID=UPI0036F0486C
MLPYLWRNTRRRVAVSDLASNEPGAAVRRKLMELQPNRVKRTLARLYPGSEIRSWADGLKGERVTGRQLNRLRPRGWQVLHAIQWPSGSDIDHLVIGPAGVFTVNSKRHKGKTVWYGDRAITVNRAPTRHIAISQHEAQRTAKTLGRHCTLPVPVRPIICIVDAAKLSVKNAAPPVLVVEAAKIVSLLSGMSPVLPPEMVQHIYQVARRQATWA